MVAFRRLQRAFSWGGVFVWLLLVREKGGFSAGKRKEKKGLRGETREGSFLSSVWREDICEKENERERGEENREQGFEIKDQRAWF